MNSAGVYLHIPFCRARCSYCDFATGMYEAAAADRYVPALVKEIERWQEVAAPAEIDTIYFGGGTPSLLSLAQLESILTVVRRRFVVAAGAEITVEINPGDGGTHPSQQSANPTENLQSQKRFFRGLRDLGVNRASFGAQTFNDRELKLLGRTHDGRDIRTTFETLRGCGFDNISFDLIAGLPGQTLGGWKENLDHALRLRPEHLSLYLLDVHEGTPLADQIRSGMRPKPDDDVAAEMYEVMLEKLCGAGYEHYEISNFCRPGFASRHNSKYWTGAPYYGFGCSAHSYDGARRRWANQRDAASYAGLIEKNESPIIERTELNDEDARSEAVFLGMRLMRGIDLEDYRKRFGKDLLAEFDREIDRLAGAGLVRVDEQFLRLTGRGALLSNEVFAALG